MLAGFSLMMEVCANRVSTVFIVRLTSCVSAGKGFNDKADLESSHYNTDWMRSIPDETPISAIAIPGTHESLTLRGGPLAVSQVWTLEKQLRVGVRYLDIHAGIWLPTSTDISVRDANWMFSQGITLATVFIKVFDFLDTHRSEAVLMKVTLHGLYKDKVAQMVKKLIEKFKRRIWTKVSVPKLEQVRGKIIFLQNVRFPWGTENHKSYFFESNELKDVERKIKHIKWHLCGHYILLTETAAAAHRRPKTLAKSINEQLYDFVSKWKGSPIKGCVGILSMDFPNANLIRNIIQLGVCACGPAAGHPGGLQTPGETQPSGPGPEQRPLGSAGESDTHNKNPLRQQKENHWAEPELSPVTHLEPVHTASVIPENLFQDHYLHII
ncbi:hypothetical protein GOODEAATRI_010082 [Goodea atripinnis]|uniref:Phosphatidylinositol-specific phospholipase C X domain-containing protein n=1 Tax=Goodea atripinnis TaxID=208336 RepID=A0ABV0N0Y8_9TELE